MMFTHLTLKDRYKLEKLMKEKKSVRDIAAKMKFHYTTIYRELKRGEYTHKNYDLTFSKRYSAELGEKNYRFNSTAKGRKMKIDKDYQLHDHIEKEIVENKKSPKAVLGEIKSKGLKFNTTICVNTLYSYIRKEIFLNLTSKHLPKKGIIKRKYNKVRVNQKILGKSIEERESIINSREQFGHWEIDSVKGTRKSKCGIITCTERKTRWNIVVKVKDGSADRVIEIINALERKCGKYFNEIFKSITCDNGSEFSYSDLMEKSILYKNKKRTTIYYCHPYSAYERGTNEVLNRQLRRIFPKGTNFSEVSKKKVKKAQDWMNNYPRGIFNFRTSNEMFIEELEKLGIKNLKLLD